MWGVFCQRQHVQGETILLFKWRHHWFNDRFDGINHILQKDEKPHVRCSPNKSCFLPQIGSVQTQNQQVFIFSANESGIPWNEWLSKSRLKRTNPRLRSRNLGTCMNSCSKRLKGSALQSKWYLLCVSSVIQQTLKENTLVFRSSLQKVSSSSGSNRRNPSCCTSSYFKGEEPKEPTLRLRPTPTSWNSLPGNKRLGHHTETVT